MCSIGIGSSSKIAVEMVWCWIWKAKVPNNVKMFAWWACHNVLPACANLVNRRDQRVLTQPWYPSCKLNGDDMVHVLWNCEEAQRIWCGRKEVIRAWIPRLCQNIFACIGGGLWQHWSNSWYCPGWFGRQGISGFLSSLQNSQVS